MTFTLLKLFLKWTNNLTVDICEIQLSLANDIVKIIQSGKTKREHMSYTSWQLFLIFSKATGYFDCLERIHKIYSRDGDELVYARLHRICQRVYVLSVKISIGNEIIVKIVELFFVKSVARKLSPNSIEIAKYKTNTKNI